MSYIYIYIYNIAFQLKSKHLFTKVNTQVAEQSNSTASNVKTQTRFMTAGHIGLYSRFHYSLVNEKKIATILKKLKTRYEAERMKALNNQLKQAYKAYLERDPQCKGDCIFCRQMNDTLNI